MICPLVTHVIWRLDYAGVERMVFELARRLPEQGFDVRVLAAGGGGAMERDFRAAQIPLAIGPAVSSRYRGQTISWLRSEARSHRPSVWHTHLGGDIWGGLVARQEGLHPWISTVHDLEVPSWPKRWLRGQAMRAADHVVCISETVKDHVVRTYGRHKTVSVVRLGVEEHATRNTQHATRNVGRYIRRFVVVGRLVREKRVEMMVRALAAIREPWHLDIVGEGEERSRLEALVCDFHLHARVRFVGVVADVSVYLDQADACLFASREEGQGMAVLEAAAAGLPIIASDLPALRELFNQDSLAFVSVSAPVSHWTRAIQHLMSHPQAARERAEQARDIVHRCCSLERMVREYVDLYANSSR